MEELKESAESSTNSSEMPVKKETVPVGTTILMEKPFVYVLSCKFRTECCDFCFKKNVVMMKCSNCKYSYYCDKLCQKHAWPLHKQECKTLKQISPRILPDAARMLFRLIKKLENGGLTYKGYYSEKKYRMWKDLMSHYTELKNDKGRMDHISSLYAILSDVLNEDLMPNFAEFMGLYGRMCVNSFNICNQELQSLGTGIYIGASIIDHSCQPNALAIFEGTTLLIRTVEKLPYLDWLKIRISYIDVLASIEERQKELLETYYFLCDCPKCLIPENKKEVFGAVCSNPTCDNVVYIDDDTKGFKCQKCNSIFSSEFIDLFKSVVEFTEMHLRSMKNISLDLDVCKICLKRQKGLLNKYHVRHMKILDLAFEAAIDLEDFDSALEYGLELVESYNKYYPIIHPLTGLLHLKLCKLLLYKDKTVDGISHLRKASDILKITHSVNSSLYKSEVFPLIQRCKSLLNKNGIK
ncbi:histone-lysine N-methyltransferase SMYD3 isoform X1 [Euwallacea fornicatus]|uniref:histone-lysine N-methyltransferase SMYD3 isoform X1 n=2 Tax=Euwallacea fornicatus TaxID=995702 RepID=UPI00338E55FE